MLLSKFLAEHAVVLDAGGNYIFGRGRSKICSWVLEQRFVAEFEQIEPETKHRGETSSGQVFYTTPEGLVFVSRYQNIEQGDGITFKGHHLRFFYPEVIRDMLKDGDYYNHVPWSIKNNIFKETRASVDASMVKYHERIAEQNAAALRMAELKEKFIVATLNGEPRTAMNVGLAESAWMLDIYYTESDCSETYRAGKRREEEIYAELRKSGLNTKPLEERFANRFKR